MVYKMYTYSVKATAVSVLGSMLAFFAAIGAAACFNAVKSSSFNVIPGIILALLAVFFFVYVSRKLPDKVAEKDVDKKLRTNVKFAARYCKDNPAMFEAVCEMNPELAEQYHLTDEGKLEKN
ncbi:MAG: hypothetical protein IJ874_08880 [Ruminococcus sp.]|nr:hypothetical protein [Ruminococcus sp.]